MGTCSSRSRYVSSDGSKLHQSSPCVRSERRGKFVFTRRVPDCRLTFPSGYSGRQMRHPTQTKLPGSPSYLKLAVITLRVLRVGLLVFERLIIHLPPDVVAKTFTSQATASFRANDLEV
ncbi:hypothetical protein KC361_g235 [Hortaea werneckii]|nr:hypothetical protein KC361_g235 [Hortaea werneckii]